MTGFALVNFVPPNTPFPCLPIESKKQFPIVYPLEGVSFCTTFEIEEAIRLGAVVELIEGYFYKDGTDALPRYLKRLMQIKDEAERCGNFLQHKKYANYTAYTKVAAEENLPLEYVIKNLKKDIDDDEGTVKLGSCYAPEWSTLILGKARSSLSRLINHFQPEQVLLSSTDSVVVNLAEDVEPPSEIDGIGLKAMRGEKVKIFRNKVYAIVGNKNEDVKTAHHAIHLDRKDSADIIWNTPLTDKEIKYITKAKGTILQDMTKNRKFGRDYVKVLNVDCRWDWKRRLSEDGTTDPHKNLLEAVSARLKNLKR